MKILTFTNSDATPKTVSFHVSDDGIPHVMAWYGAYFAGDRYYVAVDGERVQKDRNGELIEVTHD